jgi:hypothetical protein
MIDRATDEPTLADLIADASRVHLPAPRIKPGVSAPARVIDLTVPAPRTMEIPEATLGLVEGYSLGV